MLAAGKIHDAQVSRIDFTGDATEYAEMNGFAAALRGEYSFPLGIGDEGVTFTKLTRLATHEEVDHCNKTINDLIFEQFDGYSKTVVRQMTKVIGELHDNVASHADGARFSCAQVYERDEKRRIEFAIADYPKLLRFRFESWMLPHRSTRTRLQFAGAWKEAIRPRDRLTIGHSGYRQTRCAIRIRMMCKSCQRKITILGRDCGHCES